MSAAGAPAPSHGFAVGRFLRAAVAPLLLLLFRVRVIGAEHVPATGAVLSGNHISNADPVLLWCATPRHVHFMAKVELWKISPMAWALPRLWAFPINRGAPDRAAIQTATSLLQEGELVGIFPEGTRNRDGSAEAQQGAAFIALRAGVPIVPVGIAGTDLIKPDGAHFMRFPRVTIRFGEPIHAEEFEGGRKERVAAMTAAVMDRIAIELEHARRA